MRNSATPTPVHGKKVPGPSRHIAVGSKAAGKAAPGNSQLGAAELAIIGVFIALLLLAFTAVGKQGQRKGQSFWLGFWFSFFVSPMLTSLVFAFMRPTNQKVDLQKYQEGTWWWRVVLVGIYLLPALYLAGIMMVILLGLFMMGSADFMSGTVARYFPRFQEASNLFK